MRLPERRKALSRLAAMRGTLHKSLLVCAFALALAGCGSDDGTIPPEDADNLLNQVEAVRSAAEGGLCDRAQDHAQEFVDGVNALPNDVDPEVASELTKAATNLEDLAASPSQCTETETGATGLPGVEPTDTTDTTDTTETVEPETTTTETTSTDEEKPEEEEPEETTTIEPPPDEEPEEDPSQAPPTGSQGGGGGGPTSGGLEPPTGDGKGGKPE
jgi:hypothetical protein